MKKILSVLLVLILSSGMFTHSYALSPKAAEIEMGTVTGRVGDTVSVDLTLKSNPGFGTLAVNVSYDNSKLKLKSVKNKKVFKNNDKNNPYTNTGVDSQIGTVPYLIVWQDNLTLTNTTETGRLATFQFEILPGAYGQIPITISVKNCYQADKDMTDVPTSVKNGSITVDTGNGGANSQSQNQTTGKDNSSQSDAIIRQSSGDVKPIDDGVIEPAKFSYVGAGVTLAFLACIVAFVVYSFKKGKKDKNK